MERRDELNLAALLDGELTDVAEVEIMQQKLDSDPQLKAEYEAQREVKALLAGLPEYEAPDFLATRVLGRIAEQRSRKRPALWSPRTAWVGGLAALLLGFGASAGLWQRTAQVGMTAADSRAASPAYFAEGPEPVLALPAGLFKDMQYAPAPGDIELPAGGADKSIEDFLRFASEQHNYRRLLRTGDSGAPNMTDTVLALDSGDAQVVLASDRR